HCFGFNNMGNISFLKKRWIFLKKRHLSSIPNNIE
ncbi:MAG: hypothetical protein ACI959_002180, partial [Limisphaerales bacterium]